MLTSEEKQKFQDLINKLDHYTADEIYYKQRFGEYWVKLNDIEGELKD